MVLTTTEYFLEEKTMRKKVLVKTQICSHGRKKKGIIREVGDRLEIKEKQSSNYGGRK